MKTRVFATGVALIALMFFIITVACGKGRNPASTSPLEAQRESQTQITAETAVDPLTEEDYRLLAMSPEERWDYLERRLKDLVFEMHGIVIEESVSAA